MRQSWGRAGQGGAGAEPAGLHGVLAIAAACGWKPLYRRRADRPHSGPTPQGCRRASPNAMGDVSEIISAGSGLVAA